MSGAVERFPHIHHVVTHCGGCAPAVANRLIDRRPIVAAYTAMRQLGEAPSPTQIETLMGDAQRRAIEQLGTLHHDIALSSDAHVLAALTAVVPTSRLLLGTDFPMGQEIGIHITLSGLEGYDGFTDAERASVRSGNAARLFPRVEHLHPMVTASPRRRSRTSVRSSGGPARPQPSHIHQGPGRNGHRRFRHHIETLGVRG